MCLKGCVYPSHVLITYTFLREATQKKFFSEWPGHEEGHKGKNIFFYNLFFLHSKISTVIKLEGGGGLGINGPAYKDHKGQL